MRIDARYRPVQYASSSTFHPTFLYEAVWNVALCLVLVAVDRRRIVRRGRLVGVYMVGYGLGRLWVESLRIDPASRLAGLRVNIWVSLVVVAAGLALLVTGPRRAGDTAANDGEPEGAVPDDAATADDGTADHAATATPDDAGDTAEHERG